MAASGNQMEREYSVPSLSSRGALGSGEGSETGSRYQYESGFYITSFAATIFIAGLVVVGILLITLLIVLAVMLQSCQAESSGVISRSLKVHDNEDYCRTFVFHAELNKLEADEYPSDCRNHALQYTSKGQYLTELNFSLWIAENYFNSIRPEDNDGHGVILIEIDAVLPGTSCLSDLLKSGSGDSAVSRTRDILILRLYAKLQSGGWPLRLLTRMTEAYRNATMSYLMSRGYKGGSLIMRSDDEVGMNNYEYFSRRREALETEGFHIVSVISSQMDALIGKNTGKRVFKLPSSSCPQHTA
ncbi:hypothetical protein Dimus_033674 [Dionaea muscipula]